MKRRSNEDVNNIRRKKAYYEEVKLANFRESSRLESINPTSTHLATPPKNRQELEQAKQAILKRYK